MDRQSAAAFYVDTTGADAAVLRTSVELDREVRAKYRVLVRVTDSAQRSADAEVVVMVTDVNDNAPSFPQFPPINIREGMIVRISFGWGKGGNVTSAGWQVTLCDPIWHVSSRSGEAGVLRT